MAFQQALDYLSSTVHKDSVSSPLLEVVTGPFRDSLIEFPWNVPKDLVPFLSQCGIGISGLGTMSHPHPAHKTIETHLLHQHWHHMCTRTSSVVSMKQQKFNKLKSRNDNFSELVNYVLTPTDSVRFSSHCPHLPNTPDVFMHDSIMYFSPSQILSLFQDSPQLERLFASLVVPPETSFTDISLFPDLYTMSFHGPTLHYTPEGHAAGSYDQPISALDWLKISSIRGGSLELTVTILESWGPCHSLLITRGAPLVSDSDPISSFSVPDSIALPEASALNQDLRNRLVPRKVYDALFSYTRAVRTLRVSDPAGFVRTQSNKREHSWVTSSAWDNLQHFALLTASSRPLTRYNFLLSPFQSMMDWLSNHSLFVQACIAPVLSSGLVIASMALAKHTSQYNVNFSFLGMNFEKSPRNAVDLLLSKPHRRVCKKRVVNASLISKAIASLFSLRSEKKLTSDADLLCSFFPQFRPKTNCHALRHVTCAIAPLAALGLRRFFGPNSVQELHDEYERVFHPRPWKLEWKRAPVFVKPQPFLPFKPMPRPAAQDPNSPRSDISNLIYYEVGQTSNSQPETAIEAEPNALPPHASPDKVDPSIVKNQPETVSRRETHGLDPLDLPAGTITSADLGDLISFDEPANNDPPASHNIQEEPKHDTDLSPHAKGPTVFLTRSQPQTVHVQPETPVVEVSSDSFGSLSHGPKLLEPRATAPLLEDPTAFGPVQPFSQIFPAKYIGDHASFPSRARLSLPSDKHVPVMSCLLSSVSMGTGLPIPDLWASLCRYLPDSLLDNPRIRSIGLSTDHLTVMCAVHSLRVTVFHEKGNFEVGVLNASRSCCIKHVSQPNPHFSHLPAPPPVLLGGDPKNSDLVRAIKRFRFNGALLPFMQVHQHPINVLRAKNLISCMKNGFDGILSNVDPLHPNAARDRLLSLDGVVDVAQSRCINLVHIAGFAGCGKSLPIRKLLSTPAFKHYRVTVPTVELRSEWKGDLKLKPNEQWKVSTWESGLLKTSRILVIDEVYKLPRGYLDLALIADPNIEFVIILGDPLQGSYHSLNPESPNHRLTPEEDYLRKYIDVYCFWTYRVPKRIADCLGVPSFSSASADLLWMNYFDQQRQILCCSTTAAKTLQQMGYKSCTISSSQGSTYSDPITIQADANSRRLSHSHSLVAVTRCKSSIFFSGDKSILDSPTSGNLLFHHLYHNQKISLSSLFPSFSSLPLIMKPMKQRTEYLSGASPSLSILDQFAESTLPVPNDSLEFHSATSSPLADKTYFEGGSDFQNAVAKMWPQAPYKPATDESDIIIDRRSQPGLHEIETFFLPPHRRPLHQDLQSCLFENPSLADTHFTPCPSEPVYPGECFEALAAHFLPCYDPEDKEILHQGESSCQFPYLNVAFELSCQPSSLCAASHSSARDPTLLAASIAKRLRFRESNSPYRLSPNDWLLGQLLYQSLCSSFKRNPNATEPFDERLFIECINLNEYAQLTSKTKAVIQANADRSDPDWRHSVVRIFSKTQHKVNENSLFQGWKACQTLALMHDYVILTLGPVKKYQRIFDQRDRPRHVYVHAGHTPFEMSDWCKQHLSGSSYTANDYTSFDQSQHGEAVVLEVLKMRRLNIPEHLIMFHVAIKTSIETQFGPLTCMRLTGEPGTYDDNTDYNLAVMYSQFVLGDTPVMVSGDDSCILGRPLVKPGWNVIKSLLSLRFKQEFLKYPLFCGYYVGEAGACRSPISLFAKLAISVDDGSFSDKIPSYLTEFSIGHSLGQSMWNLLPIEQVSYQSACFDFFCRKCTPMQKTVLKLGEVPLPLLEKLACTAKWVSKPLFSLLSAPARELVVKSRANINFLEDPDVSKVQGELLHNFSIDHEYLEGGSMEEIDNSKAPQPSVHSRPGTLPPPPTNLTVVQPFQMLVLNIGEGPQDVSTILANNLLISQTTGPYRFVKLRSLEAVVYPSAASMTNPTTLDIVWCTTNSTTSFDSIMITYGGRKLSVGGPLISGHAHIIPGDLNYMNPVLKDSTSYTDTPKLLLRVYQSSNPSSSKVPVFLGSVVIRGELELSCPLLQPSA
nr:polyprotein [Purple passionfruit leaf deformation virus]UVW93833.1 polyprotein [Purple passionfruit leaf deformation virus]